MRDLGPMQNPQAAFFLNSSLESLHVRMPRHCENGLAVAKFLQSHPKVRFVSYPGLEAISTMTWLRSTCQRYLRRRELRL